MGAEESAGHQRTLARFCKADTSNTALTKDASSFVSELGRNCVVLSPFKHVVCCRSFHCQALWQRSTHAYLTLKHSIDRCRDYNAKTCVTCCCKPPIARHSKKPDPPSGLHALEPLLSGQQATKNRACMPQTTLTCQATATSRRVRSKVANKELTQTAPVGSRSTSSTSATTSSTSATSTSDSQPAGNSTNTARTAIQDSTVHHVIQNCPHTSLQAAAALHSGAGCLCMFFCWGAILDLHPDPADVMYTGCASSNSGRHAR
jgi:hypothetical protein